MAQRIADRHDRMAVPPTTAPPVLSLPTDELHDFDTELEFFSMDATETMWQGTPIADHMDTFSTFAADVELSQPYPNAQFVGVEAGSAMRMLAEQMAHDQFELPVRSHETTAQAPSLQPRSRQSADNQTATHAPLPIPMPRNIVRRQINVPEIAVSDWSPHAVLLNRDEMDLMPRSAPQFSSHVHQQGVFESTASTSFLSTHSALSPWSGSQELQHQIAPEFELQSPITSLSSFDFTGPRIWGGTSVPTSAVSSRAPHISLSFAEGSARTHRQDQLQVNKARGRETTNYSERDVTGWAQGAYNVSDRMNFGSLAPQAASPQTRRRKVSRSRSGSIGTIPCGHEGCDKSFASKSSRDHHARWHGPRRKICAVCGKGFVADKDLRRHEKIHRPAEHEFFCHFNRCQYSIRGFARRDHMIRHIATHSGVTSAGVVSGYPGTY